MFWPLQDRILDETEIKEFCIITGLQWTKTSSQCPCYAGDSNEKTWSSVLRSWQWRKHYPLLCTLFKWSLLSKRSSVSWTVKLEKGKVHAWRVYEGLEFKSCVSVRLGMWWVSLAQPREMSKSGGEQSQWEVEVRDQEGSKGIYWVGNNRNWK